MKPLPLTAWLLGFGGVIPFLVLFLALLPGLSPGFATSREITLWLLAYAAIILSFIGAVHWGVALASVSDDMDKKQMNRNYFYGVMPALLAWLALLLPHNIALFVMAGLVMLAYGADAVLLFRRLNSDYSILRLYLTAAVSLLLLASGLALTLQI
jgi:uncharacterized membrane protein